MDAGSTLSCCVRREEGGFDEFGDQGRSEQGFSANNSPYPSRDASYGGGDPMAPSFASMGTPGASPTPNKLLGRVPELAMGATPIKGHFGSLRDGPGSARGMAAPMRDRDYLQDVPSIQHSPPQDGGAVPFGGQVEPMTPREQFLTSLVTVSVALAVFLYQAAAYNIIFLGRILPAVGKGALVTPFLITFNILWLMAIWCYFSVHWADPGAVPDRWREFVRNCGDALPIAPARVEWQPGKATYCKKCSIPRPERSHHCHVCGICVLRMDHHCPYINNCVGFSNHKFFLLLVTYSCLVSIFAVGTTLPEFWTIYFTLEAQELNTSDAFVFLIFGLLALLLSVLLIPMVPIHMSLAARNATSIESNYTNMPNPFDQGSSMANFSQIFGAYGIDWFFPVKPWRPMSDGVTFCRFDDFLGMQEVTPDGSQEQDELELEWLWRQRYHVRAPDSRREMLQNRDAGPLTTLTRWWSARPFDNVPAR